MLLILSKIANNYSAFLKHVYQGQAVTNAEWYIPSIAVQIYKWFGFSVP